MDPRLVRQILAAHFAVLAEANDDRWPGTPPSRALADLEMDKAALLDHLAAIEHMLLRRRR